MRNKLLLCLPCILLVMACEEENIRSFNLNQFEVVSESDSAPVNVNLIYEFQFEGGYKVDIFHEGGIDSTSNFEGLTSIGMTASSPATWKDTIRIYYAEPGTYEIRLVVKDGETYSKSFTLE